MWFYSCPPSIDLLASSSTRCFLPSLGFKISLREPLVGYDDTAHSHSSGEPTGLLWWLRAFKVKGVLRGENGASLQALLPPSKVINVTYPPVLLVRFVWGVLQAWKSQGWSQARQGCCGAAACEASMGTLCVPAQGTGRWWASAVLQARVAVARFLGHSSTLRPLQVPQSTQRWQKADEQQCVPDASSADTGRDWTGWGSSPQPWYLCRLATNQSCSQGSGNWWMGSGWFGFFLSAVWFPTKLLQWL